MKTMSEYESILRCGAMWRWLSKHPNKLKEDFPIKSFTGMEKNHKRPMAECFSCEYVSQKEYIKNCKNCPTLELWPTENEENIGTYPCCRENSPYRVWWKRWQRLDYLMRYDPELKDEIGSIKRLISEQAMIIAKWCDNWRKENKKCK